LIASGQAIESATRHRSLSYLPGLDGLRALAVLAVLAYHAEVTWMPGGFLGVEIFFVISGYLITAILLRENRRGGRISLRRFYLRRARRLLPALVLSIVVTMLVAFFLVPEEVRSMRDDALASLAYVSNWHLVLSDVSYFESFGRPSLFLHIWSLGVEEQFYLLWPLLLIAALAFGRCRAAALLAVGGVVASTLLMALLLDPHDPNRVYYGTDTRAAGFLLGAALAMWWSPWRLAPAVTRSSRRLLDTVGVVAVSALMVLLVRVSEFDLWLYRGGFLVVALCSAVTIAVAVHPGSRVGRVLGIAPLVWIGLRSYGIYLWHFPIFMLTRPGFDVPDQPLVVNTLRVVATLVVADLSFRLVEMPIRNGALGRLWQRDRDETKARAVVLGAAFAMPLLAMVVVVAIPASRSPTAAALESASVTVVDTTTTATTLPPTTVPATTVPATTVPATTPPPPPVPLVIGDSITLGSAAEIVAALGPLTVVDAAESRYLHEAIPIVQSWVASGQTGPVVVNLGSNGFILGQDVETIISIVGLDRRLVFVNAAVPRRWEQQVNGELAAAVARHPNVGLVDWHGIVTANPSLLIDDHVHPNAAGRTALAQAIQSELTAP
jgi:peptidoglycan/LPS O-acetylase OafA/YrhL